MALNYVQLFQALLNKKEQERQQKEAQQQGLWSAIGTVAGGVGGFFLGGPPGAMIGATAGGQLGKVGAGGAYTPQDAASLITSGLGSLGAAQAADRTALGQQNIDLDIAQAGLEPITLPEGAPPPENAVMIGGKPYQYSEQYQEAQDALNASRWSRAYQAQNKWLESVAGEGGELVDPMAVRTEYIETNLGIDPDTAFDFSPTIDNLGKLKQKREAAKLLEGLETPNFAQYRKDQGIRAVTDPFGQTQFVKMGSGNSINSDRVFDAFSRGSSGAKVSWKGAGGVKGSINPTSTEVWKVGTEYGMTGEQIAKKAIEAAKPYDMNWWELPSWIFEEYLEKSGVKRPAMNSFY